MSWHRRFNKDRHAQDKREACLMLRLVELARADLNTTTNPANPLERALLRDLASLEAKARAEWVK
mgnify:CR=1 FL=1